MELVALMDAVLDGDTRALVHQTTPTLGLVARNRLKYSYEFARAVTSYKLPSAIAQGILIPEGILKAKLEARPKPNRLASRGELRVAHLRVILFVAMAHRSWSTLRRVLIRFKTSQKMLRALKEAHSAIHSCKHD